MNDASSDQSTRLLESGRLDVGKAFRSSQLISERDDNERSTIREGFVVLSVSSHEIAFSKEN